MQIYLPSFITNRPEVWPIEFVIVSDLSEKDEAFNFGPDWAFLSEYSNTQLTMASNLYKQMSGFIKTHLGVIPNQAARFEMICDILYKNENLWSDNAVQNLFQKKLKTEIESKRILTPFSLN
jgi:hypothetical protein